MAGHRTAPQIAKPDDSLPTVTSGLPFSLRLRPLIRLNSYIPKPPAPRIMRSTFRRVDVLDAWALSATNSKSRATGQREASGFPIASASMQGEARWSTAFTLMPPMVLSFDAANGPEV
jgi:hypothetical protein